MQALNSKQKTGLWLGVTLAIVMGCYAPWQVDGAPGPYAPIWEPPTAGLSTRGSAQIDFSRLILEWVMAGLLGFGLVMTAQEQAPGEPARGGAQSSPDRSRAIVAEAVVEPVVLRFPEKSIGEVLLESADDPEYWESHAPARGGVEVPAGARVQLELPGGTDLGCLARPEMSAIVSIDASNSKLNDDDLYCISALHNLQELDLSNTKVTDYGVKALAGMVSLQKIWLDGTKVTAESVETLKSLPALRKVSLAETSVDDSQVISLKEERQGQCEVVLRGGNPA